MKIRKDQPWYTIFDANYRELIRQKIHELRLPVPRGGEFVIFGKRPLGIVLVLSKRNVYRVDRVDYKPTTTPHYEEKTVYTRSR